MDSLGRIKIVTSTGTIGGNVWPKADKLNIDTTEYSSVATAIAALLASQQLLSGEGSYTCSNQTISTNSFLHGAGIDVSIWTVANATSTLTLSATAFQMQDLTIQMTAGATASAAALYCSGTDAILGFHNVKISQVSAAGGTRYAALFDIQSNGVATLTDCVLIGDASGGGTVFALELDTGSVNLYGGLIQGNVRVSGGTTLSLYGPRITGTITNSGTIKGWYFDTNGNLIVIDASGTSSGVWLIDEDLTLKTKEATLAAAVAASASGDSIKLDTDTYSVSGSQNIDTSITIEGDGPEATVYTTSVSNAPIFDITTDNITVVFRNITLKHTGGGVAATGIFSNNSGVTVVLDNAVVEISSGAGTASRGLWIESGTWILRNNAKIIVTSGTSKYGIYNDAGTATITVGAGSEINGATADIYGDQAGSSLYVNNPNLINALVTWAGSVTGRYNRIDSPANDLYRGDSVSTSDFVATINGAPSGTSVVYNAPSSGAKNCLTPTSTSQVAKMVLHNTTRSTDALISNNNTGTNTITLTATVPAGWQSGDTITIRSQTNTSNPAANVYFVDFELTSIINDLARYLDIYGFYFDTGAAGQRLTFHPYETNAGSKQIPIDTEASSVVIGMTLRLPLISKRFCMAWKASGAATAIFGTRLLGEGVATP